jgi:hypothetical protein
MRRKDIKATEKRNGQGLSLMKITRNIKHEPFEDTVTLECSAEELTQIAVNLTAVLNATAEHQQRVLSAPSAPAGLPSAVETPEHTS